MAQSPAFQNRSTSLRRVADSTFARVDDVLREVQSMERQQHVKSRFRRLTHYLEPLIDFLVMYSPAVDMLVQYDVSPSAVVWGSVKTLIKIAQNSLKYYSFIERMLTRSADILSTSSRYEKIFEVEPRVQKALLDLYHEVSHFLQRIKATITTGSLTIVMKSIFRSVDTDFQNDIQCLHRMNEIFKEEVTLAHRYHIEDHVKEQRSANLAIKQIAFQSEQSLSRQARQDAQQALDLRRSIMVWLGHIDYSTAFRRAIKKRSPNTGLWLFDNKIFRRWTHDSDESVDLRMLWIYGAPGVGKTVLSATTIEYIQGLDRPNSVTARKIAYFYGDSAEHSKGTAFTICVSALLQILPGLPDLPSLLADRYQAALIHGRSRISEVDEVFDLFREVVAALPLVYFVIDALDECDDISEIVQWMENATQLLPNLHVLFFSRDVVEVRKELEQRPSIHMNSGSTEQDVLDYLSTAAATLPCTDVDTQTLVSKTLSKKAGGMFLFAALSIQAMRSAINRQELLTVLDKLPTGVNEIYRLILERLSIESYTRRSLTQRIFRLMCATVRPLTWPEMRCALSYNDDLQNFESNKEPFKDTISELCCPLIEYHTETDTFLLAHISVREYLCGSPPQSLSTRDIAQFFVCESVAQHELASISLACISDNNVNEPLHIDIGKNPLVPYATKHWCHHLSRSSFHEKLWAAYLRFVDSPERRLAWILRWLLTEDCSFPLQQVVRCHKLLQQWIPDGDEAQWSTMSVLGDIQMALFRLDQLHSNPTMTDSASQIRDISNYERLVCVRDLAREYTKAGEIDNGLRMFQLAIDQVDDWKDNLAPRSCWLLNSLGILYDQRGETNLAQEVQRRALAIQEYYLPSNHFDTVLTINELGRIARHLEHYQESEHLHRKALHTLQTVLPQSDLHITWTKSALGRSLLKQGRPDEALILHQQVLAVESHRLGRLHPHALWTLSDIARCHRAQNKIEDAIIVQREVMDGNKHALGPDNADTLWTTNTLGILYELAGSLDTAIALHNQALEGQVKVLGQDHKHTQWSRAELARLNGLGCHHIVSRIS